MVEISSTCNQEEWYRFLSHCDEATIYHTPEWKKFIETTFGYQPFYQFIKDGSDQLIGLLPMFYVNSLLLGSRLCCVPFSHKCGYLGQADAISYAVEHLKEIYARKKIGYVEVKDAFEGDMFYRKKYYVLCHIDLTQGIDDVWGKLGKDVRRGIKKSQSQSIRVVRTEDPEDIRRFYDLNCATKRHIGVPCHPWNFFKNIFKYLGNHVVLYLGEYNGDAISGLLMLNYKNTAESGYSAYDHNYTRLYPNNMVRWYSIEEACKHQFKHYDMGRVSVMDTSLLSYKKRWGCAEAPIFYSYYPQINDLSMNNRNGYKYKIGKKVFRSMPLAAYKNISRVVFPHLV